MIAPHCMEQKGLFMQLLCVSGIVSWIEGYGSIFLIVVLINQPCVVYTRIEQSRYTSQASALGPVFQTPVIKCGSLSL